MTGNEWEGKLGERMIHLVSRDDLSSKHDWPFVYFHKSVEEWADEKWNNTEGVKGNPDLWCAPDLVGSVNTSLETLESGAHDVEVYGRSARLFLWRTIANYGAIHPERSEFSRKDFEDWHMKNPPAEADFAEVFKDKDIRHIKRTEFKPEMLNPMKGDFFLGWTKSFGFSHGLVVFSDDVEGFEYAKKKYEEQSIGL